MNPENPVGKIKKEQEEIMILTIEKEYDIDLGFSYDDVAEKVISYVISKFDIPFEFCLSLFLVNNEEIKEINNTHRGIDSATDVLSFPSIEYEIAGQLPDVMAHKEYYFNPEDDSLYLGDIIVSLDKVVEQAKEYGHSEYREFSFLLTHSCLHLMGYDHMTKEEEIEMFSLQKTILDELEITR